MAAKIEYMFRQLDWKEYGINLLLNHLRFADDLIYLREVRIGVQILISRLDHWISYVQYYLAFVLTHYHKTHKI